MTPVPGFAEVALPLPLFESFTYRIPETIADRVVPGARVVVPVRRRELVGIVLDAGEPPPARETKAILAAPDPEPALPGPLLRTAEWMAGYYGTPIGLALKAMLPAPLWGASRIMIRTGPSPARKLGGLAGDLVEWVAQKGGEAPLAAAARHFRKPLWEVADRLARVGAAELVVAPADAEAPVRVERRLELVGERLTLVERGRRFARRARQSELYGTLEELGGSAAVAHLRDSLRFSDSVLRALADSGLARVVELERVRDPFEGSPGTPPPRDLTREQAAALDQVAGLSPGTGALLFGVTGSGKTLVYLRAVERVVNAGRGAIILVPEIGLTPQMVSRVRGMFGSTVAVLHSALSEGERADAWRLLRRGDRRVAVGARSAVFAPVRDLGIIVVDEEHESSYKNGEAPRYHAHEVAMVRARLESARFVLGSATPSLETFSRVGARPDRPSPPPLGLLRLPRRIDDRPLPPVELVDLRSAATIRTGHAVPWSEALDTALAVVLERGEQAILLLNRRGYASFLQCPECGMVPECPDCSIALTLHRVPPGLRCHYCGRRLPVPARCPACGQAVQRARGVGTQQLEELAAARFPQARVTRMDLDTTSTRWSHHRILDRIGRGEVDVLLGTQMIAKGMDFPNVTLVGVVDADTALHLPDFRAGERTFQLLAQVAGRAGRGPKGGKVLVQTHNPDHPALKFAARHDTEGFLAHEAELRKNPPYPPETSLLNVVVSAGKEELALREAARVADWLGSLFSAQVLPLTLLGPAPCPLTRIKGRWRWHLLVKGPAEEIGRVVRYAAPRLEGRGQARVVLDRDPVSLL
ncbi:MAG TPA: primosomal protein N' [Gemmatimonadales bacterium]|nr:primosomal protein N' [Gemmatimonadales bacterium]